MGQVLALSRARFVSPLYCPVFNCFTRTKVQILTPASGMERVLVLSRARQGCLPAHFTENYPDIAPLAAKCLHTGISMYLIYYCSVPSLLLTHSEFTDPALRPSAEELLASFCPLIEKSSLPPLLELADKTVLNLLALLIQKCKYLLKRRLDCQPSRAAARP